LFQSLQKGEERDQHVQLIALIETITSATSRKRCKPKVMVAESHLDIFQLFSSGFFKFAS